MHLKLSAAILIIAGTAAQAASASGTSSAWTTKDMTAAVRAVGYPKPHPVKLACKGVGPATGAAYDSFRCTATYRHHIRKRFVIAGRGEGGWLCTGTTISACKTLKHGFVTTGQVATLKSLGAAADLAARGYMTNRFGGYQAVHFCEQTGETTFSCPFVGETVTITMKAAKGGYVETAAATAS